MTWIVSSLTRMGENERSLGKLCPQLPSEADNPSLRFSITSINGVKVLNSILIISVSSSQLMCRTTDFVVNVDTIEIELLYPGGHSISSRYRVGSSGSRSIGGSKHRNDELDPCCRIFSFDGSPFSSTEPGPFNSLVKRPFYQEERKRAGCDA